MAKKYDNRDLWALADKPYYQAMRLGDYKQSQSQLVDYCRRRSEESDEDTISLMSMQTRSSDPRQPYSRCRAKRDPVSDFEAIPDEFRPRSYEENLHKILEKPVRPKEPSMEDSDYLTAEEDEIGRAFFSFNSTGTKLTHNTKATREDGQSEARIFENKINDEQEKVLCEGISNVKLGSSDRKRNGYRGPRNTGLKKGRGRGRASKRQTNHNLSSVNQQNQVKMTWNHNFCSVKNTSTRNKNVRHFVNNVDEGNYLMKQAETKLRHAIGNAITEGIDTNIVVEKKVPMNEMSYQESGEKCTDKVIRNEIHVVHTYKYTKSNRNRNTKPEKNIGDLAAKKTQKVTENKVSKQIPDDIANKKLNSFLDAGRNLSDLIIGCQRALDSFTSFYHKWMPLREETLSRFEELASQVQNIGSTNTRIKSVADAICEGGRMISLIPDPRINLAARIATAISALISKMYMSPSAAKFRSNADLLPSLQADMDCTSDVFMYAMQCDQQFQETSKAIADFYEKVGQAEYLELKRSEIAGDFFDRLTALNPSNYLVFYDKLQRLIKNGMSKSYDRAADAFCSDFNDYPEALSVIGKLNWRYDYFDNDLTYKVWEDIAQQFQESNGEEMYHKVKGCICVLKKERDAFARNFDKLFMQ